MGLRSRSDLRSVSRKSTGRAVEPVALNYQSAPPQREEGCLRDLGAKVRGEHERVFCVIHAKFPILRAGRVGLCARSEQFAVRTSGGGGCDLMEE